MIQLFSAVSLLFEHFDCCESLVLSSTFLHGLKMAFNTSRERRLI